ncbi:hypothetical protein [Desulfoscipio gibsoniae]|uniref:hypothetical protein n=1 Tax=Desulfoscipio gibsoniae TaxID=102134 RepID=UPI00059CD882|nr:hypothetical protein [Desulfoscipio gibsoniae]
MKNMLKDCGKISHLIIIILVVLSLLIIATITSCSSASWKVKSQLNNPTQIESYDHYLYFLDNYSTIKMYDHGEIYDLMAWIPEEQEIKKGTIEDFSVVSPLKLVVLNCQYEQGVVQESTLNLIDVEKKEIKKIFSKKKPPALLSNYNSLDVDQKGNFYLSSAKQVLRMTPEGKENVIFDFDNLPSNQRQQDAYFSKLLVGKNDHLFVVLQNNTHPPHYNDFSRVVLELNSSGDIINTYKPQDILKTRDPWVPVLEYEDDSLFFRHAWELYRYRLSTGILQQIFDGALDEMYYWEVVDLIKTGDGEYVLLITDSDTGNCTRVWKLLKDGTPIANFISTEVTRD